MNEKQQLRKQMLTYRENLEKRVVKRASAHVCRQLVQLSEYIEAEKILFYMAIRNEIDLLDAMKMAWKDQKQVLLPRVKGTWMECIEVKQLDQLKKGTFGIPEPTDGPIVRPDQLDLVVVPGIAFDVQGYRLGYGGGYYDRLFARYPSLTRIGVLEHGQLVATVHPESHDQPMHILITSQQILRVNRDDSTNGSMI
jgi:5-formyltetrahydrofolate cyclo-ligase